MDKLAMEEEIKATLASAGWKILKKEFFKKKESLKDLLMDTDMDSKEGLDNARKYQAFFNSIEAFEENIKDILENLKDEEEIGG